MNPHDRMRLDRIRESASRDTREGFDEQFLLRYIDELEADLAREKELRRLKVMETERARER